jgi:tRNA (guanine-N7-)-methyltransferase
MAAEQPLLDYQETSFSQGRMNFAWEELTDETRQQAYADWEAGRGLISGDPRRRPNSHILPVWGLDQSFFRALALDDARGQNGANLRALLASDRPVEVEIGFGRGDFLLDRARRLPDRLLLGYETNNKATRLMVERTTRAGLANLWVSDDDVRFGLPRVVADGRLEKVHVLFPDPWWKSQYQARRLFSPPFVDLLACKLRAGGLLHFKSDVEQYGEWVRYLVEGHGDFLPHDPILAAQIGDYAPTHREFWCRRRQRPVYAYYFLRR